MADKSLRSATTMKALCSLKRDNYSCKRFSIIADEHNVTLTEQELGHSPRASVTIPRRQFNALIDFYNRDQSA